MAIDIVTDWKFGNNVVQHIDLVVDTSWQLCDPLHLSNALVAGIDVETYSDMRVDSTGSQGTSSTIVISDFNLNLPDNATVTKIESRTYRRALLSKTMDYFYFNDLYNTFTHAYTGYPPAFSVTSGKNVVLKDKNDLTTEIITLEHTDWGLTADELKAAVLNLPGFSYTTKYSIDTFSGQTMKKSVSMHIQSVSIRVWYTIPTPIGPSNFLQLGTF